MIVGRIIGYVFLFAALIAAGAEVVRSLQAEAWDPLALGFLWYSIDPASLNLAQAVVQRYLLPALWDPVIVTVLQWPTWLVSGILALVLLLLFRRRKRRRRSFRR